LKRIYLETNGDMDRIFERHLLTCLEDEDRLRAMIDQMIDEKDVPAFDAYTNESKAKRSKRHKKVRSSIERVDQRHVNVSFQLTKEAIEAEKLMKELNIGNDQASLEQAIQLRQQQRAGSDFYDHLLAKYGPKNGSANKKKGASGPSNNNKTKKASVNHHGKRAVKTDDEDEDEDDEEEEEAVDSDTLTDDEDEKPKRKATSKKHGTTMKKTRRAAAVTSKKRKISC
jgi:hypothetical protein